MTRKTQFLIAIGGLAAFIFAVYQIYIMRFGGIYENHSSHLANPRGLKGLYRTVERVGDMSISRNFYPLNKINPSQKSCIIIAGVTDKLATKYLNTTETDNDVDKLYSLAEDGHRVIIAFSLKKLPREGGVFNAAPNVSSGIDSFRSWGIDYQRFHLDHDKEVNSFNPKYVKFTKASGESEELEWLDHCSFEIVHPDWQPIVTYTENGIQHNLIIERQVGEGSIVLMSGTYPLTNASLRFNNHGSFLAYLFQDYSTVIIDEFHLGELVNPGMITLLKAYKLYGFVIAVLIVSFLYVWKSIFLIMPAPDDFEVHGNVELSTHDDQINGYYLLLRNALKSDKLLPTCYQEWRKSYLYIKSDEFNEKVERIEFIVDDEEINRDPKLIIDAYRKISDILHNQ
ncbi:MAG: hypothetical protein HRT89_14670 [Lentisphaeria bacterium]|nr:hypothetical protein [Lentisphaeria bacterium]NQZ69302.1 hypothetical protein [Lentisphaeria bacterium]